MRGDRSFVFANLKTGGGVDRIVDFVTCERRMMGREIPQPQKSS